MVDTTLYADLPFMNPRGQRSQEEMAAASSAKKNQGERI